MATHMDTSILEQKLKLPCGVEIKNRIAKSAMSEIMGDRNHQPTDALVRLYDRWASGGVGLLITGNVMIDKKALGEPRNVVIDENSDMEMLKQWAEGGKKKDTHIWVQLNHPGRQSPAFLSSEPVAPSAVPYKSSLKYAFNTPRELTEEEIKTLIQKFARSASIVKEAGFTGVQIHGAHGYLVSQFLSPVYNQRSDKWGGNIIGRMRFVLEIYRAMRNQVGPDFPIGIKINSSDFNRLGFSQEDALKVIQTLSKEGIDLIEISGGTYESPVMMGSGKKQEVSKPFFIDFAEKAVQSVDTPVVLTGGFRGSIVMRDAIQHSGVAMTGIARPLVIDPEMPTKIFSGKPYVSQIKPRTTGIKLIDKIAMLEITWYENQMRYMGNGQDPNPDENVFSTVFRLFTHRGAQVFKRRRA
jgi:2,4-dienoyl-CoA reductase-like NADH-dependent reductase (Old Yellow Enzyme family)